MRRSSGEVAIWLLSTGEEVPVRWDYAQSAYQVVLPYENYRSMFPEGTAITCRDSYDYLKQYVTERGVIIEEEIRNEGI